MVYGRDARGVWSIAAARGVTKGDVKGHPKGDSKGDMV